MNSLDTSCSSSSVLLLKSPELLMELIKDSLALGPAPHMVDLKYKYNSAYLASQSGHSRIASRQQSEDASDELASCF